MRCGIGCLFAGGGLAILLRFGVLTGHGQIVIIARRLFQRRKRSVLGHAFGLGHIILSHIIGWGHVAIRAVCHGIGRHIRGVGPKVGPHVGIGLGGLGGIAIIGDMGLIGQTRQIGGAVAIGKPRA